MTIRLIVGLGNPGPEYELTRHNAGFWFVDNLNTGDRWNKEAKFSAQVAKIKIGGEDVLLVKPQTYMNRSGLAVGSIARFFKIKPEEILVVHDELDIQPVVIASSQFYRTEQVIAGLEKVYAAKEVKENGS